MMALYFSILIFLISTSGFGATTSLHLVPSTKVSLHSKRNDGTLTGTKKNDVDGLIYDTNDLANMKLLEQGVIIPDEKSLNDPHAEILNEVLKQKHTDRSMNNNSPVLTIDLPFKASAPHDVSMMSLASKPKGTGEGEARSKDEDNKLVNKKKEAEMKSARIARLEKLARENLEEINRLKNESQVENEEVKAELNNNNNVTEETKLTEEIGKELQNNSNQENSHATQSSNDTDLVNFIMSAANTSNGDPLASLIPDVNDKSAQDKEVTSEWKTADKNEKSEQNEKAEQNEKPEKNEKSEQNETLEQNENQKEKSDQNDKLEQSEKAAEQFSKPEQSEKTEQLEKTEPNEKSEYSEKNEKEQLKSSKQLQPSHSKLFEDKSSKEDSETIIKFPKERNKQKNSNYNEQIEAKDDGDMKINGKNEKAEHAFQIEGKLDGDSSESGTFKATEMNEKSQSSSKEKSEESTSHSKEAKESKQELFEGKSDDTSQSLQDKIVEGTMMEAEILKSKQLKPNTKVKKKKVKILILDEDDQPLKKPDHHIYDSGDRVSVVSSQPQINHNMGDPCTLQQSINVVETMPHLHKNCQPQLPMPQQVPLSQQIAMNQPVQLTQQMPNVYGPSNRPIDIQHNFHLQQQDILGTGDAISDVHRLHRPLPLYHYPEYINGYLRHKIRHKHVANNMQNIQDALQPQIHYHFNFMKDNGAHNVGTEESLIKSSLSTDWSDRKRGSFAKTPDSNAPLIDKFISFIKSPASNKRNTLTTATSNNKIDKNLSKLQLAYKRSRTARKNDKQ